MSAIKRFYWDNVKYSLQLLYYSFKIYVAVILPLFLLTGIGVFLISKVNLKLSNIVIISAITSVLLFALFIPLAFLWRLIYISGYSFVKEQEESKEKLEIFYRIHKAFTSWKFVLTLFLLLAVFLSIGFVMYSYVLPEVVTPNLFAIKQGFIVGIKLVLTVLIVALIVGVLFLVFLFLKNLQFIAALLRGFLGILVKVAVAAAALFVLYRVSMLVYLRLSSVLDPLLYPLFGIS